MAAKIQDGGHKSIKTSQEHIFAYICLKFGRYVDQTLSNMKHISSIDNFSIWRSESKMAARNQLKPLKSTPLHIIV